MENNKYIAICIKEYLCFFLICRITIGIKTTSEIEKFIERRNILSEIVIAIFTATDN